MQYSIAKHSIDLTNVHPISVLGAPNETYPALKNAEQQKLKTALTSQYSNAPAVLGRVEQWKYPQTPVDSNRHEKTYRNTLSIDAPLRHAYTEWNPSISELETALELHNLSRRMLQYHLDEEIEIYRGLSFETGFLLRDALESPSHKTNYWPPQSVLSNYSTSKRGAAYFARLLVTKQVRVEAIALAANYLFTYSPPSGINVQTGPILRDETNRHY